MTTAFGFEADLRYMLALRDARAADNARARSAAQGNPDLAALLLADAKRRGRSEIDWPGYFRNIDIAYP